MKRLGVAAAGLLAALGIAACGGGIDGGSTTEVTVAKAEGKPSGELQISNWPLYIDKKTIPEFEQATGVSVKYRSSLSRTNSSSSYRRLASCSMTLPSVGRLNA